MNTFLKISIIHTVVLPECRFMVVTLSSLQNCESYVTFLQCCCTMLCAHCVATLLVCSSHSVAKSHHFTKLQFSLCICWDLLL